MKKVENQKVLEFYKSFYGEYKPIIVVAFILLAVLPVCLYILARTPSPIGFMEPEDARVWLTYYGAIVGGGIALWGVAWTINYQRLSRKEDLAIQFKPMVKFIKHSKLKCSVSKKGYEVNLNIVNIGRGEIKDLKVSYLNSIIKELLILPVKEKALIRINLTDQQYLNNHKLVCTYTDLYKIFQYECSCEFDISHNKNGTVDLIIHHNRIKEI